MQKNMAGLSSLLLLILTLLALSVTVANTETRASSLFPEVPQVSLASTPELDGASVPAGAWIRETIYAPKFFREMGNHALRYDSQGNPHIAFGGDHLYYAHHDGAI